MSGTLLSHKLRTTTNHDQGGGRSLPADQTTLDDVIVRIKQSYSNPNVGRISHVVLKEGPRAFRVATLWELIDPSADKFHHYTLRIDQIDKTKERWTASSKKSVRLDGEDPNEIARLHAFLEAALKDQFRKDLGDLHLVRSDDFARIEQLLKALPSLASADRFRLVENILAQIDTEDSNVEAFASVFEHSNEQTLRHIAAASRLVDYKGALDELKRMVADETTGEADFQAHLAVHPWMFGSEYSQLLQRRNWTRDDRLDYMLRRTVDNYLEIIEIKTAFRASLFVYDSERDVHYPSSKLSPVVGQVVRYIEEVERNRDSILVKDEEDTLKIRARVIVGRNGSKGEQAALRNLNAHLHRIEIITFDQLILIAERVLSIFESSGGNFDQQHHDSDDDIPF